MNNCTLVTLTQPWNLTSEEMKGLGHFQDFPDELLRYLVSSLSVQVLCRLSLSSKNWTSIANREELWQNFCLQKFGVIEKVVGTWKEFYRNRVETFKLKIHGLHVKFEVRANLKDPNFLVQNLKKLIVENYPINTPIDETLPLVFKGRELDDGDSLKSLGIKEGDQFSIPFQVFG